MLTALEATHLAKRNNSSPPKWIQGFFEEIHESSCSGYNYISFHDAFIDVEKRQLLKDTLDKYGYTYSFEGEGNSSIVCWGISIQEAYEKFKEDIEKNREKNSYLLT